MGHAHVEDMKMPMPWMGLDEAKRVLAFCEEVRRALHMEQHKLYLETVKPDDESIIAEVRPVTGRVCAVLKLGPNWMARNDYAKMNTLIHEMLHVMHDEWDQALMTVVEAMDIPNALKQAYFNADHHSGERFIDQLANALFRMREWQYPEPAGRLVCDDASNYQVRWEEESNGEADADPDQAAFTDAGGSGAAATGSHGSRPDPSEPVWSGADRE